MSSILLAAGLRHLRGQMAVQCRSAESDEQLLHAFTARGDQDAFAVLLRRHGPMVLQVCRRVLEHVQDAEDAFQATFLLLARNAAAVRKKTALAAFLHGAAYRIAQTAKRSAARRRKHEREGAGLRQRSELEALMQPCSPADPAEELSWREVRSLLDEEIARLPEKYRSAFVLCCLEELSQAEAARRLGVNERTLSHRLSEARKRLADRLVRRGVELTALLAASTLATQSASALPGTLAAKTIQTVVATVAGEGLAGTVSASVAELIREAKTAMMVSKARKAAMVLAVSLLSVAGSGSLVSWYGRTGEPLAATPKLSASKSDGKPKTAPPKNDAAETVEIRGRVLDPEGKAVKGARLSVPFSQRQFGVTDSEGRFRVKVPRSVAAPKQSSRLIDWNTYLVARVDGFGMAWAEIPLHGRPGELTLRLVPDELIQGHILNTEGKPIAGVRICVLGTLSTQGERWNVFLAGWRQMGTNVAAFVQNHDALAVDDDFLWVKTDTEGRFQLRGVGRDRVTQLQVSGGNVAQKLLYVVTRPRFDPAPINKAIQESTAPQHRGPGSPALLYGPSLLYVADPGRVLEGVIREAGSGKPVAGMTVSVPTNYMNSVRATSDAQGRFRLQGLGKQPQYDLWTEPGGAGSWMGTEAIVRDEEGLKTLKVDLTTARGVVVTGCVVDRTTGKGVPSQLYSVPLPGNPYADKPGYDLYPHNPLSTPTDAQGRFRLVVIPGPSILLVQAAEVERMPDGTPLNPFTLPQFSSDDRKRVSVRADEAGREFIPTARGKEHYLGYQNACIVLDVAENARDVCRDIFVERGRTMTVHVRDSAGKPLPGCWAGGLTDSDWPIFPLDGTSCTVYALRPDRPRQLAFVHPERRLAGLLTLRGDEKESPMVRLKPTGKMIGRILNSEGQPLSGVRVTVHLYGNEAALSLDRRLRWRREPILTDSNGRFRLENVIPELEHHFMLKRGKTYLAIDPPFGLKKVRSGETLDVGDIRTKPR